MQMRQEFHLLALLFLLSNSSRHTCGLSSGAWHLGSFEAVGSLVKETIISLFCEMDFCCNRHSFIG